MSFKLNADALSTDVEMLMHELRKEGLNLHDPQSLIFL